MSKLERCPWCGEEFEAVKIGGNEKRYCSTTCKNELHQAIRQVTLEQIENGEVKVDEINRRARR